MLDRWLGANITNMSQVKGVQSWHLSMMLTLQMAAYTDGLACFNFTEPFAGMHCDPMLRYVNLTVPVVVVPARSARAEQCRLRGECRHGWPPALGLAGAGASRAPAASHSLRDGLPPFRPSARTCLMRPSPADATRAQVRPRTITRVSSNDVHTTSYVLQHTRQPDRCPQAG